MEEYTYPEHIYAAFESLERSETITVGNQRNGVVFQITGVRSQMFPMIRGYTVTRKGKVQKGYRGIMLEKTRVLDWLNSLDILGNGTEGEKQ
jgi:hypothetical protein